MEKNRSRTTEDRAGFSRRRPSRSVVGQLSIIFPVTAQEFLEPDFHEPLHKENKRKRQ